MTWLHLVVAFTLPFTLIGVVAVVHWTWTVRELGRRLRR